MGCGRERMGGKGVGGCDERAALRPGWTKERANHGHMCVSHLVQLGKGPREPLARLRLGVASLHDPQQGEPQRAVAGQLPEALLDHGQGGVVALVALLELECLVVDGAVPDIVGEGAARGSGSGW